MKHFFNGLRQLTTDELKSLAVLCGGASLLVAVALVLSGSAPFLPTSVRVALERVHLLAASNTASAFLSAGTQNTYTVPTGVYQVVVETWGGGGSGGSSSGQNCYASCGSTAFCSYYGAAGGGGYTSATVSVTPGQQLTVVVGSAGGTGNYSGVFTGSTPSQATALVVAGGGGGSGSGSCTYGNPGCGANYSCSSYPNPNGGASGGLSGSNSYSATGGTQTAGGSGTGAGGALVGGSGGGGGAGGAGWYGGGGGWQSGQTGVGGAGGSSYCSPSVANCTIVAASGPTVGGSALAPSGVGNAGQGGAVYIITSALTLTADKTSVSAAGTSTLSWTTQGIAPNSCTLTGPNGTVGSGGLGGDSSGAGQNWTINGLNSADQVADTPSNSFATLSQAAYYSPTYGKGGVQGGGLVANGGYGAVADWQLNAGKWYWEYTVQTGAQSQYPIVGVFKDASSGFSYRAYPGHNNDSGIGYMQDGRLQSSSNYLPVRLSAFTNGDVIGTAYDADTGKLYFSKNGVWQNNDNFIPAMTGPTTNGVTMSASTYYTTGYEAWRAADRILGNVWYTYSHVPSVASPDWLQVDFGAGNAKTAASYSIQNHTSLGYDPINFKLQGSPDASTWTTLDTESNVAWTQGSQEQYFTIPSGNRASYRYYRLYVTGAGTVPAPTYYLIVDEFGLYPEASASPSDGTSYAGIVKGGGWPGLASYYGLTALNFGQGGAPSTVFGDSSSYSRAFTVGGTAQVSTVVSKFGGGSGYFNANASYLTTPSTPGLTPSGDFTIDLWAYPTSVSGAHGLVSKGNSDDSYLVYQSGSTFVYYGSSSGGAWDIASAQTICSSVTVNTWYHLAVVRSGSTYYTFCNGVQGATWTSAAALWSNGYAFAVGADTSGRSSFYNGYIDEVRMSNIARWTANFTPPAAAYSSDANTLLLLHMEDAKASFYSASAGGYFAYPPPSGYQALSTGNLPTPVTAQPGQYFAAATYTGNGGTQTVNGANFQPDIVWIKNRSTAYWNTLADSVRGTNSDLFTNSSSAATTNDANGWVSALNATGFTVGGQCVASPPQTNLIGNSYISWAWKKSPIDGVDIVTYTGDGAGTHVLGHALGTTPDTIIVKRTDGTGDWYVWSSAMRPGEFTKLDTTDAATMSNTPFATDLIPVMTGATTNGVTMSGSHEYSAAWYAGDKNPGTYWQSYPYTPSAASPEWLKVDLGSGRAVGAYSVQVYGSNLGNDPVDFTLQGSNDNSTWTVLDTEASVSWIVGQTQTFTIPSANQSGYRYYKVNVTRIDNANSTLITELNLWAAGTVPTATTFTVGNNSTNNLNALGGQYTAYLFSNREGFSKSGVYYANNSSDGPFVYTGFKPKFIMVKDASISDSRGNWTIIDSTRDPSNPTGAHLAANNSNVENATADCNGTTLCPVDFLANGFKLRSGAVGINNGTNTYEYIAFADVPFKSSATANGYAIPDSLRLDASNNAYLTRTPSQSGSLQKETLSFWLKRGQLGTSQMIATTPNRYEIFALGWNCAYDSVEVAIPYPNVLCSVQLLRDPSHWYHIVVAVDTTQANPSDRTKLYIDGVQAALTGTYPAQNSTMTEWNVAGKAQAIGHDTYSNSYAVDGNLADFYLIDGTALTPSSFGAADSSGYWKPKAYTGGNYGTNGFYLNFQNASSLGADASGNGNTFTLNGSPVISSVDQTVDTPTSNYATVNQMYSYTQKATVQAGGLAVYGGYGAYAGWQLTSGKWYWEVTPINGADSNTINGVMKDANSGFSYHYYPGHNNDTGFGYEGNGVVTYDSGYNTLPVVSSYGASDVIGIAYDAGTGKVYASKNGQWQNGNNLIPQMTGPTTNGVTMSASTYYTTGYEAWRAADRILGNIWYTYSHVPSVASPDWLQVDLGVGNAQTVASYSIKNYSSLGDDPINFKLQGSPDGSTWTTLDTEAGVAWAKGSQVQYFTVPSGNRASYRYYRLQVTGAGTVPAPTYYLIVDEFGLYTSPTQSPLDGSALPIGTVTGGWPGFMNYSYKSAINFGQGGSPNTTFADSSSYTHPISIYNLPGYTLVPSTAAYKFGGTSGYFSSGALLTPNAPEFNITGDYTIDLWAYPTSVSAAHGLISKGNNYDSYLIYQSGSTFVYYGSSSGGAWDIASAQTICSSVTVNTWYHLAVVRQGNTYKTFCNGVQGATWTSAAATWQNGYAFMVGADAGPSSFYNGYIDEVRFSNIARWTANFTPPSSAYSQDANTLLLLHMDNARSSFYQSGAGGYFAETPPAGFSALSTSNLPTPVVAQPNQYFDAKAYTGNGGVQSLDPINKGQYISLSNNNFDASSASNGWSGTTIYSTGTFSSGKWYAEFKMLGNYPFMVGVGDGANKPTGTGNYVGYYPNEYVYYPWGNQIYNNNVPVGGYPGSAAGDIYMVAVDMNAGQIWFGKNGTWLGSGNPSTGANPQYTGLTGTKAFAGTFYASAGPIQANFGQAGRQGSAYYASAGGYFYYQPPTGFMALTSTGGTQSIPLNFQPDLVWIKNRIAAYSNTLVSSGNGANFNLFSNSTGAGVANDVNGTVNSFNSAGFTVGGSCAAPSGNVNSQNNSYISWLWKKSPAAGIDIESYSGNGAATQTVSHTLGTTPDFALVKRTDAPGDWYVWTSTLGALGSFLTLDNTNAQTMTDSPFGADLIPVMTGPTTNGVTISASTYYNGSYPPWYVGDKNVGSYWNTAVFTTPLTAAAPQWLQVDLGVAKTVGAYTITPYTGSIIYNPTSFTLQGSNDGTNFTVLDTEAGVAMMMGQTQTFYVPSANQGSYRYYRLNVTADGGSSQVLISEFNLWPASVVPTATTFAVANQNGGSGLNSPTLGVNAIPKMTAATTNGVTMSGSTEYDPAWYAGSQNGGGYYWDTYNNVASVAVPQWIKTDFGSGNGKTIAAYSLQSYYASTGYQPADFTFQGSNDNTTWTTLDTEANISWYVANEIKTFFVPTANQASYRYYRVSITRSQDGNRVILEGIQMFPAASGSSQYIAYIFSNREGFSKSGTYIGNNAADGPYVYTGFKPKFVMIKDISAGNSYTHWNIYDSARNAAGNPVLNMLYPDASLVENGDGYCGSANCPVDFLADGFKIRDAGYWNANNGGNTYAYIAFADVPFKQSAGVGPSGYTLPYSLRFNAANSDYLSHTPIVAGNQQTWTYSVWVKPSDLSTADQVLFAAGSDQLQYNDTNGNLRFFLNGASSGIVTTNALYRDPSAWMHIVLAVDTTNPTASSRLRLYVNGVQVTSFSTATYPPQSYNTFINTTVPHTIGFGTSYNYFDGTMADINFVDGQALTPASFGQYDTNGYWRPAAYSGLYGTNGFHLNFNSISYSNFSTGSGSLVVGPLYKSSTYTLSCVAPEGATVSTSQTITVGDAGLRLTACNVAGTSCSTGSTPAYVNAGDTPVLSWSSTGADAGSCNVSYPNGTIAPANTNSATGVVAPAILGNTTYTLMCLMSGVSTSTTASVATSQPCATGVGTAGNSCSSQCIFDTSATQPYTGTGATLSWCCPAGTSAGGNFSTGGASAGSVVVTPSSPTAYTLSCASGGGTLNLTPTNTAPPPVSMSLTASPSRVRAGGAGTSALSWTVLGMASGISCIMTPALPGGLPAWNGNNPWNGSGTTGTVSAATLYTLTCGNGTASTSASVTIGLIPTFKEI